MTQNCFVYLRVSSKGQTRGDGFLRQFRACREHAKRNSLKIVGIFREMGVSGTNELDNRPALLGLFAALEENGVKTVQIEKLDRFARDLLIQETIIGDMQRRGFTLISTCEPDLCSTDPSRILIRQIFGAIAQYDRSMTVLRLRGARQRMKARHNRCEGKKPYGHHPGESETLTQMKDWRAAGMSPKSIAKELNSLGIKSRMGREWLGPTISKILARQ